MTPKNVPDTGAIPRPRVCLPAVFIDRDGTLMEEVRYCNDPEKVQLIEGAREGIKLLRSNGYRIVIVTNQAGIARGLITPSQYAAVHRRLLELLGSERPDATYMCPDGPDEPSTHRKPAPGMLYQARDEQHLDLTRSWMIGDKGIDVQCGLNAGTRSILVLTGYGREVNPSGACHIAENFFAASRWIASQPPATLQTG
jgi:D-glycero-D-manno-heptose 1,7-bisphosphate phosphatase